MEAKFLRQFLEECLQVEQQGLELYDGTLSRLKDEALRPNIQLFRDQTDRHVAIVENLLRHMGWDVPKIKESMATVMGKLTSGLSAIQGSGDYQQWKDLDNLYLAEQKCHSNWRILKTVAGIVDDELLTQAVNEVESEEDVHVDWLKKQVLDRAPHALTAAM